MYTQLKNSTENNSLLKTKKNRAIANTLRQDTNGKMQRIGFLDKRNNKNHSKIFQQKFLHEPYSTIQRKITIEHIDYNPVEKEYRDGYVNQGLFYSQLKTSLWDISDFNGYRGQWMNAHGSVSETDFSAEDIPKLANVITNAIVEKYKSLGLTINSSLAGKIKEKAISALVENIKDDYQMRFEKTEQTAFDKMIMAAGKQASRSKGIPTPIPFNRLDNSASGEVQNRTGEITTEKNLWTKNTVAGTLNSKKEYFFLKHNKFSGDILGRQGENRYQGNHTNLAGWLPAVATPTDKVSNAHKKIQESISPRLSRIIKSQNWTDRLGFTGQNMNRQNLFKDEFNKLDNANIASLTTGDVKDSSIYALCQNISAYIEFSMSGGFSRFVYDPVNNKRYITAHYKWNKGYNPFFEIT